MHVCMRLSHAQIHISYDELCIIICLCVLCYCILPSVYVLHTELLQYDIYLYIQCLARVTDIPTCMHMSTCTTYACQYSITVYYVPEYVLCIRMCTSILYVVMSDNHINAISFHYYFLTMIASA